MKTSTKTRGPLTLHVETLVHLDNGSLGTVQGGLGPKPIGPNRLDATRTGDSCDGCTYGPACPR
jgi:hypothetical protein